MERQIPQKTYINNNKFYLEQEELQHYLNPRQHRQRINNGDIFGMPIMQNLEDPSLLNTVNIMINMLQNIGGINNDIPPLEDVIVPLTKEDFNKLQVEKYKDITKETLEKDVDTQCTICVDEFDKDDEVIITPCKHLYHKHCIEKWCEQSVFCPVCKQDFRNTLRLQENNISAHNS